MEHFMHIILGAVHKLCNHMKMEGSKKIIFAKLGGEGGQLENYPMAYVIPGGRLCVCVEY